MIYLMSRKFFEKNIQKMAKYNEYFVFDGENYGVTGGGLSTSALASKYSRTHSVGSFSPEQRLYTMLREKKRGIEVNDKKFRNEVEAWVEDKSFISGVAYAYKALNATEEPMNLFIVIPNIIYKYLGSTIYKEMVKLAGLDFECVFMQDTIKEDKKCLKDLLGKKKLKAVKKAVKKIEKDHKLKRGGSVVEDDDDD